MFADDTALFYSGVDPIEVCRNVEEDLKTVSDYFASLKLSLNKNKRQKLCIFIKIQWRRGRVFFHTYVDSCLKEAEEGLKYLGILIDFRLKLATQLKKKFAECSA